MVGRDAELGVRPCSYCSRTNKKCTLNPSWAVSQHQTRQSLVAVVPKADLTDTNQYNDDSFEKSLRRLPPLAPKTLCPSPTTSILEPLASTSLDVSAKLSTNQYSLSFLCGEFSKGSPNEEMLQIHSPFSMSAYDVLAPENLGRTQRNMSIDSACFSTASADSLSIPGPSPNGFLTANLLQVYQDVLESNLICWVSETTCPYLRTPQSETGAPEMDFNSRGPRIYQDVMRLDANLQRAGILRLTTSENRAATKALDLAILAFAAQWQGSRRPDMSLDDNLSDNLMEDLELGIQQSMWEQAKSALGEVSELECARVMYAELIFGLTERPENDFMGHGMQPELGASFLPNINKVVSFEKPPVYLERAARKMHALKHQVEKSKINISESDRRTVELLFWLNVIMDTISSTLYERPLVIADEACLPQGTDSSTGWKLEGLATDSPKSSHRWPFSHDLAATEIARSVPVTVLLCRQVRRLQDAARKGASADMEKIVQDALSTVQYWNTTFGRLFRDMLRSFKTVPPLLSSWFTGIHVSWHLATLMLSDIFDSIQNLEIELDHQPRNLAQLAAKIRKSSASELSELAGITNSLDDSRSSVLDNPLLAQPYTFISTRAFSKAAAFHLETSRGLLEDDHAILGYTSRDYQESMEHYENCVKTLCCLGGKSNQASRIAEVFLEYNRKTA